MSRKTAILAMLADEPNDPFLNYSLAMEYRREGDFDRCLETFGQLISNQPPYVPAFFMAAQVLVDLDRIDAARSFLRDGIEAARAAGDRHAAGEMSEYLATLGELGESRDGDH
jgi:tetratricopeptide (TPR) repeat protein